MRVKFVDLCVSRVRERDAGANWHEEQSAMMTAIAFHSVLHAIVPSCLHVVLPFGVLM